MKFFMRIALGLSVGMAAASLAMPAQAYLVKGAGKCSGWVGGQDDRFWVLGFISGYNFAESAQVSKADSAEQIYKFISRFCKERPDDDLADAATSYIKTQ